MSSTFIRKWPTAGLGSARHALNPILRNVLFRNANTFANMTDDVNGLLPVGLKSRSIIAYMGSVIPKGAGPGKPSPMLFVPECYNENIAKNVTKWRKRITRIIPNLCLCVGSVSGIIANYMDK